MSDNKECFVIAGPNMILNMYGKKAFNIPNNQFAVASLSTNIDTGMPDMQTELGVCIRDQKQAEKLAKSLTKRVSGTLLHYGCPDSSCGFQGQINTRYLDTADRVRNCPICNQRIVIEW